jgi:hypothetical protein
MEKHQDQTRYQLRQSRQTLILQFTSYTASSVRSGKRRKSQLSGRKALLLSCLRQGLQQLLSVPGKALDRSLLERMKDTVDTLRHQQVGFQRNRSCIDQIATLFIIVEQSSE